LLKRKSIRDSMMKLSVSKRLLKKRKNIDMLLLLNKLELSKKRLKSREQLRRLRKDTTRKRDTDRRSIKGRKLKLRDRETRRLLDRKKHSIRKPKLEKKLLLRVLLLSIMLKSGSHNRWLKRLIFKMTADNTLSQRNARLPTILKRLQLNLRSIFFRKK